MWLKTEDRLLNLNKLTDIYLYEYGQTEYRIIATEETGESYCLWKCSDKKMALEKLKKIAELISKHEKVLEV